MPDDIYNKLKNIVHTTAEQEIGYKQINEVPGISNDIKTLCDRHRKSKLLLLNNLNNAEHINNYRTLIKRVKLSVKKKNDNLAEKISEMEENFKKK